MRIFSLLAVFGILVGGCGDECEDPCYTYFEETCPSKAPNDLNCNMFCDTPSQVKYCPQYFSCLNSNKNLCQTSLSTSDFGDACHELYHKCTDQVPQ
jgi:hypothetical protein